jgi:hypothetical protein
MKQQFLFFYLFLSLIASGCTPKESDNLEKDFLSPQEMSTGVYWYWMSDNISKEGVVKDLQAMKKAGINSVFIGNIGGEGVPYGNVKLFSDEWWDVLHTALKTAGELGIEVGMFNCPGWSHSGGPWIKAEQSMRHLVASETRVKGPAEVSIKLPVPQAETKYKDWTDIFIDNEGKPSPFFQDVKVVAFPIPEDYQSNLFESKGASIATSEMLSSAAAASLDRPVDVAASSPLAPKYIIPGSKKGMPLSTITLKLPQAQDARSIEIYPASYGKADVELQAKVEGIFTTVASFRLYRVFPIPSVGYIPLAPMVTAFPKVRSNEYRLVFSNVERDAAIGKIVLSATPALDNYPEKMLARMYQHGNPAWTEYKWLSPQPDVDDSGLIAAPQQVIDLTDKMNADGTLNWDVPEGNWLVLRTGMIPNEVHNSPAAPEGKGLEMDKLIGTFVPDHFDAYLGEVLRHIPAEDRPTLKVMIADSWEKGAQTFTDGFIDTLKQHYGYDATPFLPVLSGHIVGSPDLSERFLWDVRRLSAEMAGNNLLPAFNAVGHKHGIETWIENYGDWGFPGEFLLYGKHTDRVGGEFWTGWSDIRYIQVAASCAHIYNKDKVYAEAFTGGGAYLYHPYTLKQFGDAAFAAGMTRCVLHVYIEQPYEDKNPGIDAWFGMEFNRKNTWFSQIDLFTDYLKRCGLMIEQGLNVADVAYFIGEDVPVNSGPFDLKDDAAKPGLDIPKLPAGYQFDYVNSDVIINDMTVKNGLLTLPHGTSYRMLVLPPFETMRPELLQKIEQLVAAGAVILGPAPNRSPSLQGYPEADKKVQDMAAGMWKDTSAKQQKYGKGSVLNHMNIEEALTLLEIIPDVRTSENIVFNHRTCKDKEIYFIANQSDQQLQFTPEFRQKGLNPEWWNPVTGEIHPLPVFEQKSEAIAVPLQLEPYESGFVVFRKSASRPEKAAGATNYPQSETLADITSPWTVTFESDAVKRGPSEPVIFEHLQDWSQHSDNRIKYYSGTAVYKNTFTLNEGVISGAPISLNLDTVNVMAKVKINGQYAGGLWTPPYKLDISGFVKEGENELEIEVVSTWVNRIVGDQSVPKEKRLVDSPFHPWATTWDKTPLQQSGLSGSVKVVQYKK